MYGEGLYEEIYREDKDKDDRIPLDQVLEDMCFHEVGWIQDAATAYYHMEYLGEVCVKNPDRKWWQIWKPRYIWTKKDGGG